MKKLKIRGTHCYCAFCRNPRTIYRKSGSSGVNVLQAGGVSLLCTFLFWEKLDPRALLIFVVCLMILEVVIHFRTRSEIACPHCGFDPVLYLKNKDAACAKVKVHIAARQNDPNVWLARRPPLRFSKKKKSPHSTRELVV